MEVLCLVMYLAMKMMLESTKLRTLDYVETFFGYSKMNSYLDKLCLRP